MPRKRKPVDDYCNYALEFLRESEGVENLFGKKKNKEKKGGLKNFFSKMGQKVKQVGKIALLLPFKGVMSAMLRSKGRPVPSKLEDIAVEFFNTFLKKGSPVTKKSYEDFDPVTISVIVSAIIAFIKGIRDKKSSGAELSSTEEKIYDLTEQAGSTVNQYVKDVAEEKTGQFIFSLAPIALIAVLFFVLKGK